VCTINKVVYIQTTGVKGDGTVIAVACLDLLEVSSYLVYDQFQLVIVFILYTT
jgi:hypothetical protein